jgi:hypothetical protein
LNIYQNWFTDLIFSPKKKKKRFRKLEFRFRKPEYLLKLVDRQTDRHPDTQFSAHIFLYLFTGDRWDLKQNSGKGCQYFLTFWSFVDKRESESGKRKFGKGSYPVVSWQSSFLVLYL